jgi:hypothetical protein
LLVIQYLNSKPNKQVNYRLRVEEVREAGATGVEFWMSQKQPVLASHVVLASECCSCPASMISVTQ